MRQFVRSLPFVAVAVLAVFATVATLKSQDNAPGSPQMWEYATVIGFSEPNFTSDGFQTTAKADVRICFASEQGCRNEFVEVSYGLAKETNAAQRYNQAFSKASARLGTAGWELTDTVALQDATIIQMYFRRPLIKQE